MLGGDGYRRQAGQMSYGKGQASGSWKPSMFLHTDYHIPKHHNPPLRAYRGLFVDYLFIIYSPFLFPIKDSHTLINRRCSFGSNVGSACFSRTGPKIE